MYAARHSSPESFGVSFNGLQGVRVSKKLCWAVYRVDLHAKCLCIFHHKLAVEKGSLQRHPTVRKQQTVITRYTRRNTANRNEYSCKRKNTNKQQRKQT